jgi:hypothetical protein
MDASIITVVMIDASMLARVDATREGVESQNPDSPVGARKPTRRR